MSVPETKRSDGKLKVVTKSRELESYTVRICSNEKNFPKRYRWCVTNKIVDAAIEIANCIEMANSVFVKTQRDYALRRNYQLKARAHIFSLLSMIDLGYRTFGIESNRVEFWTSLVCDVRKLLDSWIKSEEDRYKDYWGNGC